MRATVPVVVGCSPDEARRNPWGFPRGGLPRISLRFMRATKGGQNLSPAPTGDRLPGQGFMKAAPFEYSRPSDIDEACAMLAADDAARVVAGGQTLVPLMAMRLARPSRLIDI